MNIDSFLEIDTLSQLHDQTEVGRRVELLTRLGDLIDKSGANTMFSPRIDDVAAELSSYTHRLRLALSEITVDHVYTANRPIKPEGLAKWRKKIAGKGHRKLHPISVIGAISGVLKHNDPVHIIDACSGAVMLSTGLAYLRGITGSTTHVTAVDIDEGRKGAHEMLRISVGQNNPHIRFVARDIRDATFDSTTSIPVFCLSKHACGPATSFVVDKVATTPFESRPVVICVMTCCHGKAKEHPPEHLSSTIIPEDWALLSKTADWLRSKLPSEILIVGRVAMRIMDCLRLTNLPEDLQAQVSEVVDPRLTPKNHLISLSNRS